MPRPSDPYLIDSHKLIYHPERVAQWKNALTIEDKLNVYPIYIEISPVGHCNHRCTFCAVDYIGYKTRKLDTLVLCRALSSMAIHGVKSVMFAGEGEPMLHPDIDILTCTAYNLGIDVAFTTNGTALTDKFIESALYATKWIKVSINGGEKTYAKIHQCKEGDWKKVWSNIERAIAYRRKSALTTTIGAQTVVLPDNLTDIPGLARRTKEAGCDYIVLKPYSQHKSSQTTQYSKVTYEQDAITDTLEQAREYGDDSFKVIARTQAMEDWDAGHHQYHTCSATPYFWAYIMATGDVYSCSAYLLNPDFNMGNINDTAFADIWQGAKRRKHLQYMEGLDISQCRLNCRMNQVNKHLSDLKTGNLHENFI